MIGSCVAADVTRGLVERDDASTTYRRRRSSYHRDGIRLVMQNVTADHSIEGGAIGKCLVRGDHEFNLSMSGRKRPGLRATSIAAGSRSNATTLPVSPTASASSMDMSPTPQPMSSTRIPGRDTAFSDQSSADVGDDLGLELQSFDLEVRVTQDVDRRSVHLLDPTW